MSERNIAGDVKDWVAVQDGRFTTTQMHRELNLKEHKDKHSANMALFRLRDAGVIAKYGKRSGEYRLVEAEPEPMDFINASTAEYPIHLPLGLSGLCKLHKKSIVMIAGATNAGKSALVFNIIRDNMATHDVRLMTSEMSSGELKERLESYGDPIDTWNFSAYSRAYDFTDLIKPDALNLIDYMEINESFSEIGNWITEIHNKLNDGVCVIAIQKNKNTKENTHDYGRGGSFSAEKAKLYLSLDWGQLKIVKAKSWRHRDINPNGLMRDLKIVEGIKLLPQGNWYESDSSKFGSRIEIPINVDGNGYHPQYDDFVPED